MEFFFDFEQLPLKSEYLYTKAKKIHLHESENSFLISWNGCNTVLYPLESQTIGTLFNPTDYVIIPLSNPVSSVLTFQSKLICIVENGTMYHLKNIHRYSPDLFDDCSLVSQATQEPLSCSYEWTSIFKQKFLCKVKAATFYSEGIVLVIEIGDRIELQFLKIAFDVNNEFLVIPVSHKLVHYQKEQTFVVDSFTSCIWKKYISVDRAKILFKSIELGCKDVLLLASNNSKIYATTSDTTNVMTFLDFPQKIIHTQFLNTGSKKLIFITANGILMVIHCDVHTLPSYICLPVTRVECALIVDYTVIVSDSINLLLVTLDEQFSTISRQVVTPLKGILSLRRFKDYTIAFTQLHKVYKLSSAYHNIVKKEKDSKCNFETDNLLLDIKDICKSNELLAKQNDQVDLYLKAISLVARKNLIIEHSSFDLLIYSGHNAVKLGGHEDEYIFAIRIFTTCQWLSFPSKIWKIIIRVIDSEKSSSNCEVYPIKANSFNFKEPLVLRHHLPSTIAENITSGFVNCEFVCSVPNTLGFENHCMIIPLRPVKLNALYFVKVENSNKIPSINPLVHHYRCIFKYPEQKSLADCLKIIMNKNKHRTSKSLYKNIIEQLGKSFYLNYFGKTVSVVFDDKIKKIILESYEHNTLISVRNGIINELCDDNPAIINCNVLADIQKNICLIEQLSLKDQCNKKIMKNVVDCIQKQISADLPV
ncbi:uncharacterized protein LOC126836102 [Adelges cooleyi]|uniref:uncharacterized protein LOC126836102 n=1 Tax=Adelges cooleyi TaxID=133065 RepID=UPI0021803EFC|nr:uncharacterized protein LOC126836102 [Adelges cooleyi]